MKNRNEIHAPAENELPAALLDPDRILPPDKDAMEQARERQESLAKPPHSLGLLEDISIRMAGITGTLFHPVEKRRLLIFCADNGIVEEGVASAPKSVTLAQTVNLARGLTGAAVLAKHFHTELDVMDVGVDADFTQPGVRNLKIAHGTKNFARCPAMSREECLCAVRTGVEAARRAKRDGMDIIGTGEMGIGNTTTASAVAAVLLGLPAAEVTGRGAGINDAACSKKIRLIDEAAARYRPDPSDPVAVLTAVGGLDIAAMCGAFLGAASLRLPVVIDGFISAAAALCAFRIEPLSASYMFPSHVSREKGFLPIMHALGLEPYLSLGMRLGEGSGCPPAFEIIAAAERVIRDMATFAEADIDDSYLGEIRANRTFRGD